MEDFGYDISNYTAIAPMFGIMEDFENMMKKAKELGAYQIFVSLHFQYISRNRAYFLVLDRYPCDIGFRSESHQ